MNYTENYHLPQWDETDRIMRVDFNAAMADIEAGLDKTAADAAAATAEADAHAASAAAKAADARAAADAAQATANAAYCPTNLPYVVSSYTGTREELEVTVGFQPRFLLITLPTNTDTYMHFYAAGLGIDSDRMKFTARGFTVYPDTTSINHTVAIPALNVQDRKYVYIAFR